MTSPIEPGHGATLSDRADALEHQMIADLDRRVVKSVIYTSGDRDPTQAVPPPPGTGHFMMGDDTRLAKMPEAPTLLDFFKHRFGPANHVLQSATHALKAGQSEKIVLACLLHDISVAGFIRGDHGYWGAQMIAPYVDEEVSWAIKYHQALRFFADESVGYAYPEAYIRYFGDAYEPEPYIKRDYEYARNHKWYLSSRSITLHDVYSFDPNAKVSLDDFVDIIGRNFRQPKEGLGFDNSSSAHIWRTIIWPTKFL
ncbi:HD domain-containing protein [Paraburkholderia oxyphila]|uniref:HD domain-containing protein n=1 Tax=Paraburkholderia oxyphila TaxID=614212 RepID=UPI0004803FDA|nr:HD domain-containing protein [Paraburkholderia oxyphila]